MRVLLLGNRQLAVDSLAYLVEQPGFAIRVVLNPTDHGRDDEAGLSLKQHAARLGVMASQPARLGRPEQEELLAWAPDLVLSCSYAKRVPAGLLDGVPVALNVHFALLPRHRGCLPVVWAIASGDAQIGVTLHHMSAEFDDGPIVARAAMERQPGRTAAYYYHRCATAGLELVADAVNTMHCGRELPRTPQDEQMATYHRFGFPATDGSRGTSLPPGSLTSSTHSPSAAIQEHVPAGATRSLWSSDRRMSHRAVCRPARPAGRAGSCTSGAARDPSWRRVCVWTRRRSSFHWIRPADRPVSPDMRTRSRRR